MSLPAEAPAPAPARLDDEPAPDELAHANPLTVLKTIGLGVRAVFRERPGQIIGVSLLTTLLWGFHGQLDLLGLVWPAWKPSDLGNAARTPILGFAWDREAIHFLGGGFLVVLVPILVIKLVFKEKLSDYGLGLPPAGRRRFAVITVLLLLAIWTPLFTNAATNADMQAAYPVWKKFSSVGDFLLYELCSLPFFIAIEFMFRGFLMYGLARPDRRSGADGGFDRLQWNALIIQMLAYMTWHLGKPLNEVAGLPIWGFVAGTLILACRSIWPITLVHWTLNVYLDWMILGHLGMRP
jgi:hypothetical protein